MARLTPELIVIVDPPRRRFRLDVRMLPPAGQGRVDFLIECRKLLRHEIRKHREGEDIGDVDLTAIAEDGNGWRNLP